MNDREEDKNGKREGVAGAFGGGGGDEQRLAQASREGNKNIDGVHGAEGVSEGVSAEPCVLSCSLVVTCVSPRRASLRQ